MNGKCKLTAFRGNRFNVLFWNGAAVYYHRDSFRRFFSHHGTPNRLLQAVKQDLDELMHVAGCRALGIVDKLVTGPFWQLFEGDEVYLSLNHRIETMKTKCSQWAEVATLFSITRTNCLMISRPTRTLCTRHSSNSKILNWIL